MTNEPQATPDEIHRIIASLAADVDEQADTTLQTLIQLNKRTPTPDLPALIAALPPTMTDRQIASAISYVTNYDVDECEQYAHEQRKTR